jgi:alanine-synthesizing transaminase
MAPSFQFQKLASLPPYILAQVDQLKNRLRAEGREIYDFGLGNPDGESPPAAVARLQSELGKPGFNRYMPSRGILETREAICEWYDKRFGVKFSPEKEAVATIGSKEGIAHLLFAAVGNGDCIVVPDPAYPIHQLGVVLAGGTPVYYPVGPGKNHFAAIETAFANSPRKPAGLIVNFPHNPTSAVEDLGFFEKVVALCRRENIWVMSDLAYADMRFDGKPVPSIFQVEGARDVAVEYFTASKSYNMPGWRVGFCVGNAQLIEALATVKGYVDYGSFAPAQLAAATMLRSDGKSVDGIRELYRHRAELMTRVLNESGWPVDPPAATMFVWAPIPEKFRALGSVKFATQLLEGAGVAVAPGTAFGPGGEGFVRLALVEPDERVVAAGKSLATFLK